MTFPTKKSPLLMIVSGPAGSGKTTLCDRLVDTFDDAERVVTCTTRGPRFGEVDGRDYNFFSTERFEEAIAAGEFLEWAEVHGARYGTLRQAVFDRLQAGLSVVLNIDVQGAASIRKAAAGDALLGRKLVTVFVLPKSLSVIRERMVERGTDGAEVIEKRLKNAQEEMLRWSEYDFCVLSGSKDEDYRQVESIWIAEQARTSRLLVE